MLPSGLFGSPSPQSPASPGGYPGPRSAASRPADGFGQPAQDNTGRQQLPPIGRQAGTESDLPRERGFGREVRPAPGGHRWQLPDQWRYEIPEGWHGSAPQPGGARPADRQAAARSAPRAYTFPDEPGTTNEQSALPPPVPEWRPPTHVTDYVSRAGDLAPLTSPAALDAGASRPQAAPVPVSQDDDTQTSPLPVILPGATELPRPAPVENPRGFFEPARLVSAVGSVEPPSAGQQTYEPPRPMPEEAAAKLDQIKDLYLTAGAIGEDALDKHFDQVSQRQRELIDEFFRNSAPGGRQPGQ